VKTFFVIRLNGHHATTLALAALIVACSSTEPGPASPALSNASRFCTAMCAWSRDCQVDAIDRSCDNGTCEANALGLSRRWRESYTSSVERCFAKLECNLRQGDCINEHFKRDFREEVPAVQVCNAWREKCAPDPTYLKIFCDSLYTLNDDARAAGAACADQPCENLRDCLINAGAWLTY